MSPRKSSTSSGRPRERPRYLAVEVAGGQPFPPALLERELVRRLERPGAALRLIRAEGARALVRIDHTEVPRAGEGGTGPSHDGPSLRTVRSYGTLRKGKLWLQGGSRPRRRVPGAGSGARERAGAPDDPPR